MLEEFDALLCARYPEFFSARKSSARGLFGFECGDGWFPLLDAACKLIQQRASASQHESLIALQVKEKFGGLRFYYRGGGECVASVVELTESLSQHICEICADPGRIISLSGWMRTRCQVHKTARVDEDLLKQDARGVIIQAPSMAEVLGTASTLFARNSRLTVDWLTHPALALGNVPPLHLLATEEGQHQVLTLLGRIEFGVLP